MQTVASFRWLKADERVKERLTDFIVIHLVLEWSSSDVMDKVVGAQVQGSLRIWLKGANHRCMTTVPVLVLVARACHLCFLQGFLISFDSLAIMQNPSSILKCYLVK